MQRICNGVLKLWDWKHNFRPSICLSLLTEQVIEKRLVKFGTPYIAVKCFYILLVSWKYEMNISVEIRHRRFVVLSKDWVFIVIGVMEIWNPLYFCELFLYIFGFVKIWKYSAPLTVLQYCYLDVAPRGSTTRISGTIEYPT